MCQNKRFVSLLNSVQLFIQLQTNFSNQNTQFSLTGLLAQLDDCSAEQYFFFTQANNSPEKVVRNCKRLMIIIKSSLQPH